MLVYVDLAADVIEAKLSAGNKPSGSLLTSGGGCTGASSANVKVAALPLKKDQQPAPPGVVTDGDEAQPRLPLHNILVHRLLVAHHHAVEDIECQLTHQCDTCTQKTGKFWCMRCMDVCAILSTCSWDHLPG